jgi:D-alanine-D-alanine ligase
MRASPAGRERFMNVWVIMGGLSAERDVSLDSGRAVAGALKDRGHQVWAYELGAGEFLGDLSTRRPPSEYAAELASSSREPLWSERLMWAGRCLQHEATVAFLALHGGGGEDGTVQALLDSIPVPYTGSGPSASAIAMDKVLSKRIMEALGIPTPAWTTLEDCPGENGEDGPIPAPPRELPLVVKPVSEGSSVGVGIVREAGEWEHALALAWKAARRACPSWRSPQLLIEEYIKGRELTVGVLRGEALPVVEIRPKVGFYDYERKYTAGASEYLVPADLPPDTAQRMQVESEKLFRVLGCRGMARVDYRFSPAGDPFCLELNTIPGLTSTSLLPKAAAAVGMGFGELLEAVCRDAIEPSSGPRPAGVSEALPRSGPGTGD